MHGGAAGRSTDFANHTIRTLIDYARALSLSVFILFLDLEKAYDRVIREIVMGFPQHLRNADKEEKIKYLIKMGCSNEAADFIMTYLEGGCVFERWGGGGETYKAYRCFAYLFLVPLWYPKQ